MGALTGTSRGGCGIGEKPNRAAKILDTKSTKYALAWYCVRSRSNGVIQRLRLRMKSTQVSVYEGRTSGAMGIAQFTPSRINRAYEPGNRNISNWLASVMSFSHSGSTETLPNMAQMQV